MLKTNRLVSLILLQIGCIFLCHAQNNKLWVTYPGSDGPGKGKNIVFISGDEEYRSEEALPMLAKILSKRYGFTCRVLFAIDPQTGEIDPTNRSNIPGLSQLATADLMVIFTRHRELPDSQMKYIDDYLKAGKPVVGLRTATHAFNYQKDSADIFSKYDDQSIVKGWEGGFGKLVLGETWVNHHGIHKQEGTRGLINGIEQNAQNPILNGVKDIWAPTDVYEVRQLGNAHVLIYGLSTDSLTPTSPVNLNKSIMPVAWINTYRIPGGKSGRSFTTTMGAAIDFLNEDLRRLLVNACFWATGLEKEIPIHANVDCISPYKPTMYGFGDFEKGTRPSKYEIK
jgi:hypothetical protein